MNCLRKDKKIARSRISEFYLTTFAYSMLDRGYTLEKVKEILDDVVYISESMVADQVKFYEIRKALKDEYGFEFEFFNR